MPALRNLSGKLTFLMAATLLLPVLAQAGELSRELTPPIPAVQMAQGTSGIPASPGVSKDGKTTEADETGAPQGARPGGSQGAAGAKGGKPGGDEVGANRDGSSAMNKKGSKKGQKSNAKKNPPPPD